MKDENDKNILESTKELIYLLTPGPLGRGLTRSEAAKELGISPSALDGRLKTFRKRHPEAYKRYRTIYELAKENREKIQNIWRWGDYYDLEELEDSGFFEVKEKW